MLVLSRKIGEEIVLWIGGEVVRMSITRVDAYRGQRYSMRIQFDAPLSVNIDRKEIYDRKMLEGPQACAQDAIDDVYSAATVCAGDVL